MFKGPHRSLECIRMHAQNNIIFDFCDDAYWDHLHGHIASLTRERFPALKRVILHGKEWKEIMAHSRFIPLRKALVKETFAVHLEDGSLFH
jgi:hypothetical protein